MSDPAIAYRDEVMLAGWSETHTGGAKVTFWLPSAAALEPFRAMTCKKGGTAGQRFYAVLVELSDTDEPAARAATEAPGRGGVLARSAVMVCKAAAFQAFVAARCGIDLAEPSAREEQAKRHVIDFCGLTASRSELDHNPAAAAAFGRLMSMYREHADG